MNFIKRIFHKISHLGSHITQKQILLLAFILGIPAFILNLFNLPIIGDEGIRNLVALEMKLSGNFIVPTLNGELYLNKPPLFNWFIFLCSEVLGTYGEAPSRWLNLLFLFIYAYTVYYWSSKNQTFENPLLLALMLLTSGRILFWDSMYGLIDVCFSWIVFLNFMVLYHFGTQRKWSHFFLLSYLLCSVAFMLKGLPALVFQAISITTALIFFGVLKDQIISRRHIFCGMVGLLPVVSYYLVYMSYVPLENVFAVLTDQSMRRTASHHGIYKTIIHFFTFPFEQIYHFLPWSLFIVFIFTRKFWNWISQDQFVKFNFILLLVNIPVYWLSVEVYPRYLLMFIPLFNLLVVFFYHQWKIANPVFIKIVRSCFLLIAFILTVVSFSIPWLNGADSIPNVKAVTLGSGVLLMGLFMLLWRSNRHWLIWFALFMFGIRIVFDLTVLQVRGNTGKSYSCKLDAKRIHESHQDLNWYIFDSTEIHQISRFYLTNYYQKIITRQKQANDPKGMYLVDPEKYPEFSGEKLDSLYIETGNFLHLMKLKK